MVEDSKIETTKSPFAMRKGEIKVFDGKDGYVSINQVITKINIGHIGDLHFKILDFINEFEFITSRQLCMLLELNGIDYQSQDKLNNKLEQMVKSKILTRYYFSSDEGKGIYKIYCLEKMGKYLLTSREKECKWQPTDNTKPTAMIKKRLAGNQAMIAYMRKVKNYDSYCVKPAIVAKGLGKTFKPSGGSIKISKAGKSISFLFESIRREDEWEKRLIEKMRMYQDFYKNFNAGDCGYTIVPQLIFVCEDDKHMVETFKTIITNNIEIEKIKLFYTTDLKQNGDTLAESLNEFVLDTETNKYKIEKVNIKLLS